MAEVTGAAVELTREAMRAPGTAELREAGCDQAMVYTPERFRRFFEAANPDREPPSLHHPLVVCQLREGPDPGSDAVARAYATAVDPRPSAIGVTVQVVGQRQPTCEGLYGPDGASLGAASEALRRLGNVGAAPGAAPSPAAPGAER